MSNSKHNSTTYLDFGEIENGSNIFIWWIYGIFYIYEYFKSEDFIHLFNVPFYWYEEESKLHSIVVRVENKKIAQKYIDEIIDLNGTYKSFKANESEGWEYLFIGDIFNIGYLPDNQCIRINKIDQFESISDELDYGTYLKDKKLRGIIKGSYKIFYCEGEGPANGRFCVKENGSSSWAYAFYDEINDSLEYFKTIVKNYNDNHEVFSLSNDELDEKVSGDGISFKNQDFELLLIRENVKYKFFIFPPGGLLGEWSFLKEKSKEEKAKDDMISQMLLSQAEEENKIYREQKKLRNFLEEELGKDDNDENNKINFCPSCGKQIEIQGNFCTNCGHKFI
jgi:hypothetical protein